jgi:peptidoglycan/xylan/chitin deacetylase (PgdA/CDA1 family)
MSGASVLTFHRVVRHRERDHDVEWTEFRSLLDRIPAERVTSDLTGAASRIDRVVLTFDDATADHAEVGRELSARGMPAIFFVPPALLGDADRLTTGDVSELLAAGHAVGGHGWTHTGLDRLNDGSLRDEIVRCRDWLADVDAEGPKWFAPPGGRGHPALTRALAVAGFDASRTTEWGILTEQRLPWSIPSVPVTHVTLGRGWVDEALAENRLPLAMRAAWLAKQAMPTSARLRARSVLHRSQKVHQ